MNNASTDTITTPSVHSPDEVIETVVSAVADAEGVSPLELRPLAEVIDPDALNTLVRSGSQDVTIEFTYHEYCVRVDGDGRVTVGNADDYR